MSNSIKFILFLLLSLPLCLHAQQTWNIQPVQLQSRWANEVSPAHTHNEYPRPQMERRNWENLNGLWDYAITDSGSLPPAQFKEVILVPYPVESALSGVKKQLLPNQALWYHRKIQKPSANVNERTLLHFGAVDWQATVYLNQQKVGEHRGGYQTFSLDITPFLKAGENELLLKVYDPTDRGIGPHGKQVLNPESIYYTASSGIWQTVWLEKVPQTYIEALKVSPDLDQHLLSLHIKTNSNDNAYTFEATVMDGKKVVVVSHGHALSELRIPIPDIKLWSPDDPFLYDLRIRLLDKTKVVDEVKSYFGMRKVEIKKDAAGYERIFLNNTYTYNLGVLDQGFWPEGLYTAPNDSALQFDIKAIKSMGFNTIRKHIKVEPERWYYYTDKLGLLVWQDFVNPNQGLPKGAKEEFEREAKETVDQLYNHPSIITWVLFNERWGQYDQARLTNWLKHYDPSRIVNGHSGELLYVNNTLRDTTNIPYINSDLTDVHSYPNPRNAIHLPGKAMVVGEFGGIGVPMIAHQWDDLQGWGYIQSDALELKRKYREMTQLLKDLEGKGLSASIYTQPFDVEGEENGLMTYDREIIKIPLDSIREINALLIPPIKKGDLITSNDIKTQDNELLYRQLLTAYEQGRRDTAALRTLALLSINKKSDDYRKFSDEFISHCKNPFEANNLKFILFTTKTSDQKGFELVSKFPDKVNASLYPRAAERKMKEIIYSEDIAPYLKSKIDTPNWELINKHIIAKYGVFGEEYLLGQKMAYYWKSTDMKSYAESYVAYYKTALYRSDWNINNFTWKIFEHVQDKDILEFAAEVGKINFEKYDTTAEAADTYANLLYKLGRLSEAMLWEEKAISMSDGNEEFKSTLAKMKKGQPTWIINN